MTDEKIKPRGQSPSGIVLKPWLKPDVIVRPASEAESSPNPVVGDGPFSFGS